MVQMADRFAGVVNSSTVLVTNNSEPSVVACICCAELELELEKTRIELRSTQKIVELLREEMSSAALEVRHISSVVDEDCISVETTTDCLHENAKVLCCAKVKNTSQSVKTILETLVETVKVLKEDQDYLSVRLDNMECSTEKKGNTELNTNNKAIHANVWRMGVNSKSPMKSATTQPQEFKIQTVINRYATLENQHEENQVQRHNYKKKLVNVKKTKTRTQQ
jgi:hypothetical protein